MNRIQRKHAEKCSGLNHSKRSKKMTTTLKANVIEHRKAIFSTLWIFAVLNYLYCDVMSLMDSGLLNQYIAGTINGIEITQGFLLAAAILMEVSMGMVLLSRVLPYRANRWANIVAATLMTLVQIASLFVGSGPTGYYIFCSVIEIATTTFIVWYAWTWRQPEVSLDRENELITANTAVNVSDN
jgi:hypothetical protein